MAFNRSFCYGAAACGATSGAFENAAESDWLSAVVWLGLMVIICVAHIIGLDNSNES